MVTGKQHLRLTGFAVLAETVLLELVLNERVERRAKTIRSEALAAEPGSRRQCATANFSSSRHLPQRRPKSSSSRLTLPRLLLAMRAIQGVGTISGSRQQIVEAELPVHRAVDFVDAHPLLLVA